MSFRQDTYTQLFIHFQVSMASILVCVIGKNSKAGDKHLVPICSTINNKVWVGVGNNFRWILMHKGKTQFARSIAFSHLHQPHLSITTEITSNIPHQSSFQDTARAVVLIIGDGRGGGIIPTFIIQMMVPQKQSVTSTIRKLCEQIETEINDHIKRSSVFPINAQSRTSSEPTKLQFERIMQELKAAIVQALTSRLPALIHFEQSTADTLQDLAQQRDEWLEKYKRTFKLFEEGQLENDRLKIEVVALSESYEQLSVSFEQMKYKYHELQQQKIEERTAMDRGGHLERLNQLNLLSRDSATNSASSDRQRQKQHDQNSDQESSKTIQEMRQQKNLFVELIHKSQLDIATYKTEIEELISERERLWNENQELQKLLKGEKIRSDRFDREILDILNKNQELKLQALEQKQLNIQAQEQCERARDMLAQQKENFNALQQQKDAVGKELIEQRQAVALLKLQNSQQRESFIALEEKERDLKGKITELKKENQQLRLQLQSLMKKLDETTESLSRAKQEETIKYRHQIQAQRSKTTLIERETKAKTHEKVQQISKMHKEITYKLQQKIHLLQKGNKDKKEKATQLKFEVERLYESLQIQVEKQFKSAEKIKELTNKLAEVGENLRITEERFSKSEETKQILEQSNKSLKSQLHRTTTKLRRLLQLNKKLNGFTLPKLKEELHSIKLLCQHFCTMIDMEKEQTTFLLTKKQEHFKQLIEQTLLQKTISREQTTLSHQNEIAKWKENCRNYEEKYDRLKSNHQLLQDKHNKLQILYEETIKTYTQKMEALQEENEKKKLDQAGTMKTIQRLKQKCKEVEQYYKLVDELSRENLALKGKLETASYYSFKSPEKIELDNTSKRQKFTEDGLQRYNKTSNLLRPIPKNEEISMNDLTAKAEFQKLRLEAARREYNMINRAE